MDKISSIKTNSRRIQIMNVDRKIVVNSIEDVPTINPSKRVYNNTSQNSENFALSSLYFYETLDELKQDLSSMQKFSSLLEQDLSSMEKDEVEDTNENSTELLLNLKKIIARYNSHIYLLKKLDTAFGGHNVKEIHHFLSSNNSKLLEIGIFLNQNMFLEFNEKIFKTTFNNSSKKNFYMNWLFNPTDGFLKTLFYFFKKVKFNSKKSTEGLFMDTSV